MFMERSSLAASSLDDVRRYTRTPSIIGCKSTDDVPRQTRAPLMTVKQTFSQETLWTEDRNFGIIAARKACCNGDRLLFQFFKVDEAERWRCMLTLRSLLRRLLRDLHKEGLGWCG